MTKNQWEDLFIEAVNVLRKQVFVPYKTGNLKFNAIKSIWINDNTYRIYIDESIAPYVYFTNEVWINRKGTNPNRGWVDKMVNFIANYISTKLGGEIKK